MKFTDDKSSAASPRILCVEDNDDSLDLMDFMLRQEDKGYVVTSARTAEEAMSLMENKQNFDIYILDFWLSEMSGIELCRKIRQSDKLTPIMFFTAMARPSDRRVGLAAGASEYLVKPNDLPNLTETVKRLLDAGKTNLAASGIENKSNSLPDERTALQITNGFWRREFPL